MAAVMNPEADVFYRVKRTRHWSEGGLTAYDYFGPYNTVSAAKGIITVNRRYEGSKRSFARQYPLEPYVERVDYEIEYSKLDWNTFSATK